MGFTVPCELVSDVWRIYTILIDNMKETKIIHITILWDVRMDDKNPRKIEPYELLKDYTIMA